MSVYSTLRNALFFLILPTRLVIWWLYFIPKSNRQNPAWSWKTSVSVQAARSFIRHHTAIRYRTPKSLEPGPDGDRFIILNPQNTLSNTDSPVYKGILNSVPDIKPVPTGAVWYPAAPVQPPKKLVIHFHPSAFVILGARPSDDTAHGWGLDHFSELSGWPVLSIQYRLSLDADKTFPAALQDAFTAYAYALGTLKIHPSHIVLAGESAGGNLVLAMLRYILTDNQALPLPRSALLLSPWVDLTDEGMNKTKMHQNARVDYIGYDLGHWGATSYIPPGWEETSPYFTPLGSEYKLSVPLFVHVGTSEVLYDDIMQFARNMKEKGTDVELHEAPNAPHAIFSAGKGLGMEDVAIDGHARATRFIERTGPTSESEVAGLR
ncbi:Alpha/Beta hydrolase protein [Penicillium angulare]|uniref:Alpha/Beta hydrolase protein n=1 Tax=Penicillium angulare TaxID=116970 RepID=UPI002541F550|nr:Alpha/Beta hydrolase protein [Penicillium angulare]KAJ5281378.1 Alpha/Beta hydrolase protein [Penicillium angulare]